jgi:hypothetical protein
MSPTSNPISIGIPPAAHLHPLELPCWSPTTAGDLVLPPPPHTWCSRRCRPTRLCTTLEFPTATRAPPPRRRRAASTLCVSAVAPLHDPFQKILQWSPTVKTGVGWWCRCGRPFRRRPGSWRRSVLCSPWRGRSKADLANFFALLFL